MSNLTLRKLSSGTRSLVLIEFALFTCSLLFSIYLNRKIDFVERHYFEVNILFSYAAMFALIVQLTLLALGLYNTKIRESFRGILRRLTVAIALSFFFVTMLNPLFFSYALPIELYAVAALTALLMVSFFRYLAMKINFFGFNKRKVLILGAGARAAIIERRMRRDVDRQGFFIHGFVAMDGDLGEGIQKEPIITIEGSMVEYASEHNIDEIVIANDERRNNLPVDELFACKIRGIEIIEILDFIEREIGQIAVNLIYPSWVIYSNGFTPANELRNALDWLFNASIALILLVVTWPIMLVTALLIKLDEGLSAPVFYLQERVGLNGESFNIIKFRSMRLDAEKSGAKMASINDDRVTKIGHFIRKVRIDELPQIYNVLRGDMGFVGPRPERPEFVRPLIKNLPYYNERHNVKPGLTGWAQLRYPYGASENDSLEKLKYDLYYIKHRSFMLDVLILIRTVEIVLFGKGR